MTRVSITSAEGDLYRAVTGVLGALGGNLIAPGDVVLIKPNLVEPAAPDSGQITSPGVIEAVARYCLEHSAARVIIGEGPGYYQPESYLRDCFTRTGVSRIAERLGVEWVLFDEHRYRTFKNISDSTPREFRVTEFAFSCDKFINLPVLKTHYLTTVTLAMKNLKGCLKREDKPAFHYRDLSRAVVALSKIVRPTLNIIDATRRPVRQLGSGYQREAAETGGGLLIASRDIVAVDAVGSALMGLDPAGVRTVSLGAAAGLGESDLTRMEITGEELRRLKFRVKLPRERLGEAFPGLEIIGAEKACSGCLIPLLSCFWQLSDEGRVKPTAPLAVVLGKDPQVPPGRSVLLVGDCAVSECGESLEKVPGCPPDREEMLGYLARLM